MRITELRELRQLRAESSRLKRLLRICHCTGRSCRRSSQKSCEALRAANAGRMGQVGLPHHGTPGAEAGANGSDPQEALRRPFLKEMAAKYVRYEYRLLSVLLRREGCKVNPKRVTGSTPKKG
jgi:hypothetical protein